MKYVRWLLFPFSLLYGLVVIIRNWCYDAGFFKSDKFNKPVISVGNLDVGGAGKSPMTEYLIRLLKDNYNLATLSRGYGRKTKGYHLVVGLVNQERRPSYQKQRTGSRGEASNVYNLTQTARYSSFTTAAAFGDEPALFKQKFPDITVAVCEKRVEGIKNLLPGNDLILLDDAFQHRAVEPGLSILLFDYNRLNEARLLLPAGILREPFSGRWRAQVIVVTKCPAQLTTDKQHAACKKIEPSPYQKVFFSSIAYQPLEVLNGPGADAVIDCSTTVFLLTGIANSRPLVIHLNGLTPHIIHHNYPDHHKFTLKNIAKLAAEFLACKTQKKVIITTEKDAQRLKSSWLRACLRNEGILPVLVLPIKVKFLNESGQEFDRLITEYVRTNTAHN